jgi:transposase
VQTVLAEDPYAGHVFAFRGRRGDLVKLLWSDGDGMCLLTKRLERGRFVWPQADSGSVSLSAAQLSMLLEGIDWRRPERTWQPRAGGVDAVDVCCPWLTGDVPLHGVCMRCMPQSRSMTWDEGLLAKSIATLH